MVNKTAGEINQELDALTKRYQELQTKAQEYSNALEQERRKGRTLDNQVSLLKSKVQKTENTIDTLTVQIQRLQLEEQKTRLLIEDRQLDIQETRGTLETILQNLFELSKRRGLVAFLQYPSVAKYFSEQTTLWQIQRELGRRVEHLQNLKDYLEIGLKRNLGLKSDFYQWKSSFKKIAQAFSLPASFFSRLSVA